MNSPENPIYILLINFIYIVTLLWKRNELKKTGNFNYSLNFQKKKILEVYRKLKIRFN
jgi:hypothetical protein